MKIQGVENIFPFDGWVIESIGFAPDLAQIKLRRNRRKRLPCGNCGASMTPYRETTQSVRDLPLATARDVLIFYPAVLGRCPKCRETQTFLPPGIQPYAKATDRLMRYISLLARFLPISQVTQVTGIPAATARRWDKLVLSQDLPPVDLDGIGILLIDEKHLGPSLGFVTVVMDDLGNPLYMAEGKKKESLQGFFDMLDDEQKEGIHAVCIDRAGQYKAVVEKNCPQADIVFDKFHLKKNLNDAIDKVRRQEWHNVLNYIDWRITTSRLECLNGMVERILRRCCGVTDLKYLFLKVRQAAMYSFHLQTW